MGLEDFGFAAREVVLFQFGDSLKEPAAFGVVKVHRRKGFGTPREPPEDVPGKFARDLSRGAGRVENLKSGRHRFTFQHVIFPSRAKRIPLNWKRVEAGQKLR